MEKVVSTTFGFHPRPKFGVIHMDKPRFFVGIDIASATFTSAVGSITDKWHIVVKPATFANEYDSFPKYLKWLQDHGIHPDNCVICMEATGVYNEVLAHFLIANSYRVSIEPPLKVKRAFKPEGHKSDPVDSCQISEYAYRFWDQLSLWAPRKEILEQIKVLLTTREQFVVDRTGHQNSLLALKRKAIRTPLAEKIHEKAITELKGHILELEAEIQRLIDQNPDFRNLVTLLISIPGVGMLLAAQMLVLFQSSPKACSPKHLAAFIGICPYDDSSGSSLHHTPTSRHYGPSGLRKLLFLAALSIRTHRKQFKQYFLRKLQEGKPKQLIINNIANKLLKIMCAILRSNTPFIENYRSVNPALLVQGLTLS
ncbi:MAG: IS110 family transposase [Methanothrix sp.]|nr:MAG: IS110 family transposase [Methanothrix sp.]